MMTRGQADEPDVDAVAAASPAAEAMIKILNAGLVVVCLCPRVNQW